MKTILTLIALIPVLSYGQCTATEDLTTTYGHNNGQDGIMFDVVSNGVNAIEITCIEANFDPGNILYHVYVKDGSCVGNTNNAGAWTLHSLGVTVSAGDGNPTPIALDSIIGIDCGDTVSIYLSDIGSGYPYANYTNGTVVGQVYSSNTDISILEGYGKAFPFGYTFNPRVFNGTLHYNTVACGSLPVELTRFEGKCGVLEWETATELNNDYFLIEESTDLISWKTTDKVNGAGTTNEVTSYRLQVDSEGLTYYRLTQVDFNGYREVFKAISVNCDTKKAEIVGYYNLLGQKVTPNDKGIILVLYSDGSTTKVFNK